MNLYCSDDSPCDAFSPAFARIIRRDDPSFSKDVTIPVNESQQGTQESYKSTLLKKMETRKEA